MSQFVETPTKTFTAGAAISQFARVKIASGVLAVAVAGTTDDGVEIGTLEAESFASGDVRPVRLRSAQGSCKMIASGAITKGVAVYGAAAGKVSASVSGNPIGIALETTTADGDIVEVLRY